MKKISHSQYLERCYSLALTSGKEIGTNPKVGAVLVHDDKIIGEGRYQSFGGKHAEINALESVASKNKHLIPHSTLYVSLEPCCFHGKTPACTSAILQNDIKNVHIGTLDPFPKVSGKGVEILSEAKVNVTIHDDQKAKDIIGPFRTFHLENRPYISLKWAKSKDNFISKKGEQTWLTSPVTKVYTHRHRAQMDAILIGTNTAITDDPSLTVRECNGQSPLRMVIDLQNRIPIGHILLGDRLPTVIFNSAKRSDLSPIKQQVSGIENHDEAIQAVVEYCREHSLVNLLVEGGATLLKSFIQKNLWNEALIINTPQKLSEGIKGPNLHGKLVKKLSIIDDNIIISKR